MTDRIEPVIAARGRGWGQVAALGVLAAPLGLMVVLLPPVFNTPMLDDWSFIDVTVRLARAGVLRYVQCNDPCLLSHVLVGAGWLRLVGPTVANLRVLTLLLSLVAAWSAFGILSELGLGWTKSLAGALVFQLNPMSVFCSYSWLTDTPWLAFTLLATWAYLVGLRRGGLRMWAGAALSLVAILNRQTAMAVPLGVLAYLVWRRRRGERPRAAFWLAAALPLVLGFVGLKLAERIPDFQTHGFPIPSFTKQYAEIPAVFNRGAGFLALSLLPFAVGYAGAMARAARRAPGRWLVLGSCGVLAVLAMAAPAPKLGASPLARYNAEALLLPVRPPFGTGTSYFLFGYGGPLYPRWVMHALGVATLGWVAVLVAFVLDRAGSLPWPVRIRLVPRAARFVRAAGLATGALLAAALAGLPLWPGLARRAISAAHARGFGRGQGLDYWLAMARPLSLQVAAAAAVCLAIVLSELLRQKAVLVRSPAFRRSGGPRANAELPTEDRLKAGPQTTTDPHRSYLTSLLWSFVEFAAAAAVLGPTGAAFVVLAAKLLWRWERVGIANCRLPIANCSESDSPIGNPQSAIGNPRWSPRDAVPLVAAGALFVFLVVILSRWEVYKRHFLPVVVPAVLVLLRAAGRARLSLAPVALVAAVLALYGLLQTDVYVAQMQATERMRRQLIEEGVDPKQIRVGLELDGLRWRRYTLDHPDERGHNSEAFWHVTWVPVLGDRYLVAGGLNPEQRTFEGYETVRTTTFRPRLWPGQRPLYVLRRPRRAGEPPGKPGEDN